MEAGTRSEYVWLELMIGTLIVLNAVDGAFTIYWVDSGQMREANPLMELLISTDPVLFMSVKLLLVGLGSWLLWRLRHSFAAVVSVFLCFTIYLSVIIYHLDAMNRILFTGPLS